jgi:hypothetical protein
VRMVELWKNGRKMPATPTETARSRLSERPGLDHTH